MCLVVVDFVLVVVAVVDLLRIVAIAAVDLGLKHMLMCYLLELLLYIEYIRFVSYQNCDLSLVLITMTNWPDAIPRSVRSDYAIAIKAFASTNPPHPNRSVEY